MERPNDPETSAVGPAGGPAGAVGSTAPGAAAVAGAADRLSSDTWIDGDVAPPPREPTHLTCVPASPPAVTELREGQRLGRWVLEREIGRGATATVWAAHHERLGSPVAIKVFHKHDLAFQTVLGEARAAAGIPSPYAVWVYDVDTYDGHHAIVMELCASNGALAESLQGRSDLRPRQAARLIAQAARGVSAGHAGGLFHKDIKPANILVHPRDGRAQVTDFGLANPGLWRTPTARRPDGTTIADDHGAISPSSERDPHGIIRGPVRVGTPEFMAPEQARGLRRDLDARDPMIRPYLVAIDVYGLGATLYALLAGRPPYPHSAVSRGASAQEVMAQVIANPPLPLRQLAPKAPRRLVAIVERAMARDPLHRYPSVDELAGDLEAWLDGRPTLLETTWWERLAVTLWRERVRVGYAAGLAVVTALSSLVVAANTRQIQHQGRELATQQERLDELLQSQGRLRWMLTDAEESLVKVRSALEAKDDLLDDREHALAQRGAVLERLTGELDAVQTHLQTTTSQLDEAAMRVASLEDDRARLSGQLDTTRAHLDAVLAELARSSDALADTRDALAAAVADREVARIEVDRLSDENARLDSEWRAALGRASAAQAELVDVRGALQQARAEVARLQAMVDVPPSL